MHTKNITEPENFCNIYLWGLIWADGHVSKKRNCLSLEINAEDFIDIFGSNFTLENFKMYNRTRTQNNRTFGRPLSCLYTTKKEITQWFILNDFGDKSLVDPAKILSKVPKNLQYLWWRGYFDGDGCFYCDKDKPGRSFTLWGHINQDYTSTKELFNNLGIKYTYKQFTRKSGRGSFITIRKVEDIEKLGKFLYQDHLDIGLKRKYHKYLGCLEKAKPIFVKHKSDIKGVHHSHWDNKWIARLTIDKKRVHIGCFDSKEQAYQALIDRKSQLLHV